MKTIQKCVRTYELNIAGHSLNPNVARNCDDLNSYLNNGWKVVIATPKSNYIEYIIEKEVEK